MENKKQDLVTNADGTSSNTKERAPRKDRSMAKYSEQDYLLLPRKEQYELAKKYWGGHVKEFDDGTFQFSATHFGDICKSLGFEKKTIVVDNLASETSSDILYLKRGRRIETIERKFTLDKETNDKIDLFLSNGGKELSNSDKSKIIDAIINAAFTDRIAAQNAGQKTIGYPPTGEELLR